MNGTVEVEEGMAQALDAVDIAGRPHLKPPRTLETTLFDRLERMYGEGIKRVLNTQYRYARFPPPNLSSAEGEA
jgi:hypothetical protein